MPQAPRSRPLLRSGRSPRGARAPGRLSLPALLLGALLGLAGAAPARASVNEGILLLAGGKADCRAKRFPSGVKKLLDSALVLQRADASHPANRQWLPQVRLCLQAWVRSTAAECRREGSAGSLETFARIERQVKYLATPVVKRLLSAEKPRCAAQIVKLQSKACLGEASRAGLDKLDALAERLRGFGVDARTVGRLTEGKAKCALQWVKDADSRCQTTPTIASMKEIGDAVGRVGGAGRTSARVAYERCAKAVAARAWSVCQARRYQEGRTLLLEAINRYGFYKARDRAFLAKMQREWLPRCGSYAAKGYFKASLRRGAVDFSLAAWVTFEVGRTGQGNTLKGELRAAYSAVSGQQRGCRVTITPTDGRYSLTGSENTAAGSIQVLLEKGMPQTKAYEDIQVTCGEQTPDLSKGHLLHQLLARAGLFSLSLPTGEGAKKPFRWSGALPDGAKGSIAGTLRVKVLK